MQRMNYYAAAPDVARAMLAFDAEARKELEPTLAHLIKIRASQLNGCAFCLDMHVKEARIDDMKELKLHSISVWHEAELFTDRERAALEWTEAVTLVGESRVPDELYERVSEHFTQTELAHLTWTVAAINVWNRMAVSFRKVPGSMDKQMGLERAGLSA